ncbi:MAG: hypothetical protein ACRD3N_06820 [Terracidiphilus sp.]
MRPRPLPPPPDRPLDKLTDAEADEARRTYCIKKQGMAGAATAHLVALVGNPAGYLRGLALALALGRAGGT